MGDDRSPICHFPAWPAHAVWSWCASRAGQGTFRNVPRRHNTPHLKHPKLPTSRHRYAVSQAPYPSNVRQGTFPAATSAVGCLVGLLLYPGALLYCLLDGLSQASVAALPHRLVARRAAFPMDGAASPARLALVVLITALIVPGALAR